MKIPYLSIVIPTYNEAHCLRQNLTKILRYVRTNVKDSEVIVVEDGSTDGTAKLLQRFEKRIKVLRNETNQGKGYSVKRGLLASTKSWVLFMDMDLSTPLEEIRSLWRYHRNQDVIFASRKAPGAKIIEQQVGLRNYMGRMFPILVQLFALPEFLDTQCGFKLFNRKAIEKIFPHQTIHRYGFDVELLLIAKKKKLRIKEVPVTWTNAERSTLNPFVDSFKMFYELMKIKVNDWRGLYD